MRSKRFRVTAPARGAVRYAAAAPPNNASKSMPEVKTSVLDSFVLHGGLFLFFVFVFRRHMGLKRLKGRQHGGNRGRADDRRCA